MLIESSKAYLSLLQDSLISSNLILSFLFFVECLPIIYHIILASFSLSKYSFPASYVKYAEYITYYDKFHNYYVKAHSPYFIFIPAALTIFFIVYRYYLITISFIMKQKKVNYIILNFFEFFLFRLLVIFLLEVIVSQIVNGAVGWKIFCLFFLFIFVFGAIYHNETNYIFININPGKKCIFENKLVLLYDNYLFLLKLFICLQTNIQSQFLTLFFNCVIFFLNLSNMVHFIYALLTNKYVYLALDLYMVLHFILTLGLAIWQVIIVIAKKYNVFFFIFGITNSIILSIGFGCIANKYTVDKMFNSDNTLGTMVYLIKESYSLTPKKMGTIFYRIANYHTMRCKGKGCKICELFISNTKDRLDSMDSFTYEKLCTFAYKALIKSNKDMRDYTRKDIEQIVSYNLLIGLYMEFIAKKKNLVKIVLRYHKIKTLMNTRKIKSKNKSYLLSNIFSFNYLVNLEFLYSQITNGIRKQREDAKMAYLIKINEYSSSIGKFLSQLKLFFEIDIKLPQEIIKLASKYTQLKETIDISFLNSKENKYNFPCVASGYIIEEIFNDQFQVALFNRESISLIEELISIHYKEDHNILALYDIVLKTITIEECGRDLLSLKKRKFEEIFPIYLQREGIQLFLETLSKDEKNIFEYYYNEKTKHTVELFRVKFSNIPSIGTDCYKIFILCTYKIEKENLAIFQVKKIHNKDKQILIGVSDNISNYFKITPEHIENSFQTKKYIEASDLFFPESNLVNYAKLNLKLKQLGVTIPRKNKRKKPLIFIHKQTVGDIDIYIVRESESNMSIKSKNTNLTTTNMDNAITQKCSMVDNNQLERFSSNDYLLNIEKNTTHTGSSSINSGSITSTYVSLNTSLKKVEEEKFRRFFMYKYYIISFNLVSALILFIYLFYELNYNVVLEKTFKIIVHFNDFQNYFYHTALSILSLACNAASIENTECVNQFIKYSEEFIITHNLTENEMLITLISRELLLKSEEIVDKLKEWESEREYIKSERLEAILEKDFYFTAIEEVNATIGFVNITLSFEDAVKRFSNTIIQVASSDEFLTSPVYTITTDGNAYIDMSNVVKDKEPINGAYLNQVQKYYYTLLLNYQKYLLILLSIGDLLKDYYDDKVKSALVIKYIFSLMLAFFHVALMVLCMIFIAIFKNLHISYFIKIYGQITNNEFKEYIKEKIDILITLLDFYKENPMSLIKKIKKLNSQENTRKKELSKKIARAMNNEALLLSQEAECEKIDLEKISQIYNKHITLSISLYTIFLFIIYVLVIFFFFFGIINRLDHLHLMNIYTKNNFDMSVNSYINLGLIQIMSLTNQTDLQLEEYFTEVERTAQSKGYVRSRLEESFQLIFEIYKMEKQYSFFYPLTSIVTLNCDTLYEDFKDSLIISMHEEYPESNYEMLFSRYCYSLNSLSTYNDDKLLMTIVVYQNEKLLDQLTDQSYETYVRISNSELLYDVYTELLIIVRPIRGYVYDNCIIDIVDDLVSNYTHFIIIFLVVNFFFEIVIFIVIKFWSIDTIIKYTKEIIIVVRAFQCF